jgi:hypothetical protein
MVEFLTKLLLVARSRLKSRTRLEAENVVLRQQLIVLSRTSQTRVRLRNTDRLLFVWLYRLYPSIPDAITIVEPETVIRWHRRGFRAYWRWKSRRRGGRPRINRDIRDLIRQMNRENPLWGAPRIHGELLMLGIEIAESSVSRYMCRRRQPPSQEWKTFLRNHAAGIVSVDLFEVRTISFKLLYGLVILRHAQRRLVSISVTNNPTAEWIAGQVTDALSWDEAPRLLIRDRDGAFGPAYTRRIRAMGIRGHPTTPRSPWQNGHVDRYVANPSTTSLCSAKCICAISSRLTLRITTKSRLIFHWTRIRRTSAVLCRSAPSRQFRSLAGCIINTSGFRFSVGTAGVTVSAERPPRLNLRVAALSLLSN